MNHSATHTLALAAWGEESNRNCENNIAILGFCAAWAWWLPGFSNAVVLTLRAL